jgi:endonuclease/exonuclease/phosphatase family metal-dependent hydrolase
MKRQCLMRTPFVSSCVAVYLAGLSLMATPSQAEQVSPAAVDVMTFNMEHHDKPEELRCIAEHLKTDLKKVPDFILCQEVVFQRYATKADPEDNTAAVLARHLGYYCQGTKRTSDHEGIAIISKYPFDHYEAINLKNQTIRLLLGFRRVSVMGEFTVPGLGKVRVADTHLTNWGFETHVRRGQISETLQWVAARQASTPAAFTFFGGDFNAHLNSSEMEQVVAPMAAGTVSYENNNGSSFSQGWHGHPTQRIDFIFLAAARDVSKGLKFVGEKLLWPEGLMNGESHFYPSDHLAVVHTYDVDRSAMASAKHVRTADVRD